MHIIEVYKLPQRNYTFANIKEPKFLKLPPKTKNETIIFLKELISIEIPYVLLLNYLHF